jgi:hypothetical protein
MNWLGEQNAASDARRAMSRQPAKTAAFAPPERVM